MKTYWYLLAGAVAIYLMQQKKTATPEQTAIALNAIGGYGADGLPLSVPVVDVGAALTSEFASVAGPVYQVSTVQFQPGPSGAN